MIKSFYTVLDLKNPNLVIQKIDPVNSKLYRKWKNGVEEWITFYYLADGKSILIKEYKNSAGYELSYQYDDNNLIQKYEKRINGETVLTRTYQRYIARGSSEEYFMDEPLTQIQENTKDLYSERTYDMKGREILYEDEDRNGDKIMARTKYEDKRAHIMVWKNGKFIYEYYVKEGDENYGKGFKK